MELREAKKALESNGYERKLVYKLSYMTDGTWKHAYFENKEEAEMMVSKMVEVNKLAKIYSYISLNKWSWEMFIEPWRKGGGYKPSFIMWMNNKIEILLSYYVFN